MGNAGCPRCGSAVALHDGKPSITTTGVELWHRACWDMRDQPIATAEPALEPPPVRYRRAATIAPRRTRVVGAASVLGLAGVLVIALVGRATPAPAIAVVDIAAQEILECGGAVAEHDGVPPRVITAGTMPTIDGVALDRVYPSLRGWIHPVSASSEHVPKLASRRFGATRTGIERSECGSGHCGIDLDGPRGRPIVAVAAGNVVRVERSELGADGKSGRYVRIEHDDGTFTAYMHMDEVAAIEVGDRVDAGQYIGTLGATAVFNAPPHLHFSLEIPDHPGVHGDRSDTEYVDPAPFLTRARIVPVPDRGAKPSF